MRGSIAVTGIVGLVLAMATDLRNQAGNGGDRRLHPAGAGRPGRFLPLGSVGRLGVRSPPET